MKKTILFLLISLGFTLTLLANPSTSKAECGFYNQAQSRCYKGDGSGDPLSAARCLNKPDVCCTTATECNTTQSLTPTPVPGAENVCPGACGIGKFCDTSVRPAECKTLVIPSGCSNALQGCTSGGSVCPNNPFYCCSSPTLCNGLTAPNGSTGVNPQCVTGDGNTGIRTALGCIDMGSTNAITTIISWGTGIAGGIAFLMIIIAAFQITTSAGDAKRVKAAQELLTSALAGFFLIAFSVVILNLIGVNILGLQNLGFTVTNPTN